MPQTYTPIATTTLTSAAASYTFSSIPSTYTDLILAISSVDTTALYARLGNGSVDSGTNYSYTYLAGYGTGSASGRNTSVSKGWISLSSDVNAKTYNTITHFQNYSNTTTNKTFITRYSDSDIYVAAVVNLWRSTSAIDIITVYGDTSNIPSGSTLTLYGIKAA